MCKKKEEINTFYQTEIICPWCGEKYEDPCDDNWDVSCEECGKEFHIDFETETYYTTTKKEDK